MTTLIPDEVLSDSEVYQNGRQRFAPHWGTAPDWCCAKSREARKAMKDGGEEELGKRKWLAVFFHPALCSQKFSA